MNEQKKSKTCYLCRRVTPKLTFQIAHQLWEDNKATAHEIGKEAVAIIRGIYHKSPAALSGMQARAIISGILYILGFVKENPKCQNEFWLKFEVNPATIRSAYRKLLPLLDETTQTKFRKQFKLYTGGHCKI